MQKLVFYAVLVISTSTSAFSQNVLPKISPATPEQAAFAKFGNYTVNMFHGLPDISIPLYTIKSGELTLPISISYHASGIKVNDWGSWAGIGWTLNAGPSISRKVMGLSDLQIGLGQGNGFLDGTSVRDAYGIHPGTLQSDMDYLWKVNEGMIDAQPDYYYYNLPGKNGMFFFNQQDNLKPVTIPFDPVKINMTGYGDNFKITDIDGTVYDFGAIEMTNVSSSQKSAWLVSQISSANQQDKINFSYTSRTGQVSFDYQDFVVDEHEIQNNDINGPTHYTETLNPQPQSSDINISAQEQKISQITFANGKIVFSSSSADRQDGFSGQKALEKIQIQSLDPVTGAYTTIKTINFYQSYFTSTEPSGIPWYDKRLKLDRIEITDKNGVVVEKYQFDYNTPAFSPTRLSRARDFWGYYNGVNNNTSLVPRLYVPYHDGAGQLQYHWIGSAVLNGREASSDVNYTQAFSLKRIKYPTGGYTDFEYDVNKYKDANGNTKYAGGLRIKSIKNYDGVNPSPSIKTYSYGYDNPNDGFGRANFFDPLQYSGIVQGYRYIGQMHNVYGEEIPGCSFVLATESRTTWYASPTIEIQPYDGSSVVYKYVTEYIGDQTNNIGRTDYEFVDHVDLLDPPSQICYKPIINSFHMDRGQLKHKMVYRKNANNTYSVLSSSDNTYQDFGEQVFNKVGLLTFKSVISQNFLYGNNLMPLQQQGDPCPDLSDKNSFQFTNYNIRSTYNRLTQSTETTYDESNQNKSISTVTSYSYDNAAHMLPTKITTINSKGETLISERAYPQDYLPTQQPSAGMIALNILDKIIQEKNSKGTTQINLVFNKYDNQNNNNYLPSNIDYTLGTNSPETRAKFNNYDSKGNILDMQKSDDLKSSFQWGYNGEYPVAEVKNCSNDYKETVVTDPATLKASFTVNANQSNGSNYTGSISKNINLPYAGDIKVFIGATGSLTVSGSIIITGPLNTTVPLSNITLGNGCLADYTEIFADQPMGNYTITISLTRSSYPFGYCGEIDYPGYDTHIVGTGIKDFFYNGFEEDAAGTTGTAAAGKRYYVGDYTVPFTKQPGKTYYVSYHYLQSGVWKSNTKLYSTNNMTLNEGDAIDEVRVVPSDAQIVTYTYEPLIGITSKNDVNNHLIFYTYDSYNRLRSIKDEDGNILKLISYKYSLTNESATITACNDQTGGNCVGTDANGYANKKCINGSCETGIRVNYLTTLRPNGTWRCKYYYRFSDGVTTLPSDIHSDPLYIETNADPCDL